MCLLKDQRFNCNLSTQFMFFSGFNLFTFSATASVSQKTKIIEKRKHNFSIILHCLNRFLMKWKESAENLIDMEHQNNDKRVIWLYIRRELSCAYVSYNDSVHLPNAK